MYLKSLTLKGFKSFASATTLNFEPGITAIVGPNGSGKSNVVDALAWVMGEQGAKSLRGGKMEDVIFAGTSGRAALGRAEVSLTIDNSDGLLPIDYTEVTISRTLFRSGGSEYAINGTTCRLLDVQELLSDTGMGREMHVIVGQGQLDQILRATPEVRRGFIEEAAGVLKHRRRKEKASRKLASTQQNLERLNDLIREIRRQLKPLGRQAQVARRAAVIQAELRDSRARLLADDYTQAKLALDSELAGEQAAADAKRAATQRVEQAQSDELAAEQAVSELVPVLNQAQEVWYSISALRERVSTTISIAAERMRYSAAQPNVSTGRDPDELEAEAAQAREKEAALAAEAEQAKAKLEEATEKRKGAEADYEAAEKSYSNALRAVADRREGLAKLNGKVSSLKSRMQAGLEEVERLKKRHAEALERSKQADVKFAELETQITGASDGEVDLDAVFERTDEALAKAEKHRQEILEHMQQASSELAAVAARLEALKLGLQRRDGSAALLESDLSGTLGSLAQLVKVEPKWQTAVSAALGTATEAIAMSAAKDADEALALLKEKDLGRASMLVADAPEPEIPLPQLPDYAVYAIDVVQADDGVKNGLRSVLGSTVLVEDLAAARKLTADFPQVTAVTAGGDVVSAWLTSGGSDSKPSLIEVQSAVDEAETAKVKVEAQVQRLKFEMAKADSALVEAQKKNDAALERLNESDARMTALAEQINSHAQESAAALSEAERLKQAIDNAEQSGSKDRVDLEELEARLAAASGEADVEEPDPAERDQLSVASRMARQSEMDARLALRTVEERVRSLSGRADSLARAAATERLARAKAEAEAEQLRREAMIAAAVHEGALWLADRVDEAKQAAGARRAELEEARTKADADLFAAREVSRQAQRELDKLVEGAHKDEMARVEMKMRVERVAEQAMTELGLEPDALIEEYGPELMVPVLVHKDGTAVSPDDEEKPEPIPYVRELQARRAKKAQKDLELLGRVNPLALEEFDAMSERHTFLANQAEDLKKTRKDLLDLIDDVDNRVQEAFVSAYEDIAKTFTDVFARLFPGGKGKLILTDPDDMLNTGVDVEAKPAGKKVKRLSLLSGGERSLVAVAFLVSLFIARPSPFYILDEVEAALDDVNLGRLLDIYQQLRDSSQLLVITHQKRTMEIADALYGVTMRQDGISTVISQRLIYG